MYQFQKFEVIEGQKTSQLKHLGVQYYLYASGVPVYTLFKIIQENSSYIRCGVD